jgi:hypothetical protein
MKAGSSRFLFALAFALALAAGVAAGVMVARFAGSFASVPPPSGIDDLQLTDAQRTQIQKIWEGVKDNSDESYRAANQLQRQFDDKVQKLLTPDQMTTYREYYKQYYSDFQRLQNERDTAVKKAIEETKTLLSDDQRRKYDVILKSRLGPPSGTAPSTVAPRELPSTAGKKPSGGSEL